MPKGIPSQQDHDSMQLGGYLDELSGHVNSWLEDFRKRAGTLATALEKTRKQVQTLEQAEAEPTPAASTLQELAALAREVECTSDQARMLDILMSATAAFAPRCVLFVVRSDSFSGWAARGIEPTNPRTIAIPVSADTILKRSLSRCEPSREARDARPGNRSLLRSMGSATPREMAAAPIWVKDKVVGILYADSGREASGWHPEGIFLAATLVALGLEAVPLRARQPRPLPPSEPAQEESPFAVSNDVEDSSEGVEVIEILDPLDEPGTEESDGIIPTPVETPETYETIPEADPELIELEPDLIGLDDQPIADLEPELIEPEFTEAEPEMVTQTTGSQTLAMSAEAIGPTVQASDDPMHAEARRFARLLVSEILLYNEKQVREGRLKKDLYKRLREDIERSRQMYDERISTRLPDAAGYFREELINSIADGDESAMKLPWG